ncbi:MAG: hypothetical protein LBS89_01195 [Zoogloeaceae bacterium]|jgi:hypothetical protein|nr:hypothetical protein [Zoogloeaceae bacterium]
MKTSGWLLLVFGTLFALAAQAGGVDSARVVTVNGLEIVRDGALKTFTPQAWQNALGGIKETDATPEEYEECGSGPLGYFLELHHTGMEVWLRFDFENNPGKNLKALFKKGDKHYVTQAVNAIASWAKWEMSHFKGELRVDGKTIRPEMTLVEFRKRFPKSVQQGNVAGKGVLPKGQQSFAVMLISSYNPDDPENEGIWYYEMTLFFTFQGEKLLKVTLYPGNPCG